MVTVSEAVEERRSVRQFIPDKPVPLDVVRQLVKKATRSASGGNTQPWHLYVVSGDKKVELTEAVFHEMGEGNLGDAPEYNMYPIECPDSYMVRRRKVAKDMYDLMGLKRNDKLGRVNAMRRNFEFFDAPVGIIVTVDRVADRNGWGHTGMLIVSVLLAVECFIMTRSLTFFRNFTSTL